MNRGLIEGARSVAGYRLPASLPRFMNRGLIEGRESLGAVICLGFTSPIHESGPH